MTESQHQTRLGYTVDDDGVWLFCECGWEHNLEFDTTPQEALRLATEHAESQKMASS